jgi:lysophospholipase L1-like esterase
MNSSRVLRDLPHMLDALHPDVVLVLIGANDCWTVPVSVNGPKPLLDRLHRFIAQHSRVSQLIHMLRASSAGSAPAHGFEIRDGHADDTGGSGTLRIGGVEFTMGWQRGRYRSKFGKDLERNLLRIADITKAAGAELLLLTYGSEEANYGDANDFIRAAAQRTGTPLVDAAAALQPVCPREPCPAYFYEDHHPTARGYSTIARSVTHGLRKLDRASSRQYARERRQLEASR